MSRTKELCQYPTPGWAAAALVDRYFPELGRNDIACDPTCGPGAVLSAIPSETLALGVEIDPFVAEQARNNTGRQVIVGDFRTVDIDIRPTVFIGNPPFNLKIIDGILDRAFDLLADGGRVGMLLPAYMFQTASRVAGYADRWSLYQEIVPRNIYPGLSLPLVFAQFSKDNRRKLIGFALFRETADVQQMPAPYRQQLEVSGGPVWRTVVATALKKLGGEADLQTLYSEIEGARPTRTTFWKEAIRKVLRQHADMFTVVAPGRYALN